ncbi:MAG: VacB/RNase II family 3'-5' exoribonuclease [Candidatus Borkfalkiaceae bacterium]|nr:VacB/RNase II family 3'-5' exoribonuclease [Clostridia bacterium]MDY6224190.1 VacB/RNase II family 3'-5' exoribonuclease [Christensenellaceae bacterium]
MQNFSLEERVIRFLSSCESATAETLRRHAGVPQNKRSLFAAMLTRMERRGEIECTNGLYSLPRPVLLTGVLTGNERGFAFFTPDERQSGTDGQTITTVGAKDVFIPAKYLNGAMHKDRVVVRVLSRGKNRIENGEYGEKGENLKYGKRGGRGSGKTSAVRGFEGESDTGEVVKILSRGFTQIVGTFYKDRRGGRLIPDDIKYFSEIYVPLSSCNNVKSGVKAVAKITSYVSGRCPEGEICEVLGDDDDFFAEELSIIRSFFLREEFPETVENEAKDVSAQPVSAEKSAEYGIARRDLRSEFFVTIDGADTRDIDDGVAVEKSGENYVLSVHIADVSHYVRPGGALDKEAFKRGTSAYFPDRVLPMLPKDLSNGCCSLNEGEDRLAVTCKMTIAGESAAEGAGEVLSYEIFPSLVRSTYRLTYEEVDKMIEGDGETRGRYPLLQPSLPYMKALTEILSARRKKCGEVALDLREKRIIYDKQTDRIEIPDYVPSFSRGLIEQFMVTANETVARFLTDNAAPCLYRVHEPPAEEKAAALKNFARLLGFAPEWNDENVSPSSYAALLLQAKDGAKQDVLAKATLRSMQKARYSPKNLKHFALASACYCHFTSPIRRYPDLFVHRSIKAALALRACNNAASTIATESAADAETAALTATAAQKSQAETTQKALKEFAESAAKHCSETERTAEEAERTVDDLYAAVYISDYTGQSFDGVISGVTERGFFVELKNGIEGFVPLDSLDGYYVFQPETFTLQGAKKYSPGDSVRVVVADVNFYTRKITFYEEKNHNRADRRKKGEEQ